MAGADRDDARAPGDFREVLTGYATDKGMYKLDFLDLGIFLDSTLRLLFSSLGLLRVESLDCVGLVGCGGDSHAPAPSDENSCLSP